jgi:hypothetical protein
VFIDGRYKMIYPAAIARDFTDFYDARAAAQQVLDAYDHEYVLIAAAAAARKLMEARKDWELIYSDPAALLYARRSSPAAHIPGLPIRGAARPFSFP